MELFLAKILTTEGRVITRLVKAKDSDTAKEKVAQEYFYLNPRDIQITDIIT